VAAKGSVEVREVEKGGEEEEEEEEAAGRAGVGAWEVGRVAVGEMMETAPAAAGGAGMAEV